MLLYGSQLVRLDSKHRPVIPQRFRQALGEAEMRNGLVLTPGFDGCLFLFTKSLWEGVAKDLMSVHFTSFDARTLHRLSVADAEDVVPDRVGRIIISDPLRAYAGIGDEALFVGVWNRLELWSPSRWAALKEQHQDQYEKLAEKIYGVLQQRETRPNPSCQER